MATNVKNNVVEMTADNDTYGNASMGKLKIKGVRLVAAAATSTAQIKVTNTSGQILCSLACVANTTDESVIPFTCDAGLIHADISGAGAIVYVYLE